MSVFNNFLNLRKSSRTLKFEAIPTKETLENINKKGIIDTDKIIAEEYKAAKQIIDKYHKDFIERSLQTLKLKVESEGKKNSLSEYMSFSEEGNTEELKGVKQKLRKQIADCFAKQQCYKELFAKELITKLLPGFLTDKKELATIEKFSKFTTYFTGFNENRKNMYDDSDKPTGIANRLIGDNLPKFVDNIHLFQRIMDSEVSESLAQLSENFSDMLHGKTIEEYFSIANFPHVVSQKQIMEYNTIIGAKTNEDRTQVQGINEYINQYNQRNPNNKLGFMKPLYKMILSDKESLSWLEEEITSYNELIEVIEDAYQTLKESILSEYGDSLKYMLQHINDYDTARIWIPNDKSLTSLSQHLLGQYDLLELYCEQVSKQEQCTEKKKSSKKSKSASFSIATINAAIDLYNQEHENQAIHLDEYFKKLGSKDDADNNLFVQIEDAYQVFHSAFDSEEHGLFSSEEVKIVKALLDGFKELQRFILPLRCDGGETEKDFYFAAQMSQNWNSLDIITPLYNRVRNWITRKPYSNDKIKLNFNNSLLLNGWDQNKEEDNAGVLFIKDGLYYLGIIDKAHKSIFSKKLPSDGPCYRKIVYKYVGDMEKQLPRIAFSKKNSTLFQPSDEIKEIYQKKKDKVELSEAEVQALITFYKNSIKRYKEWDCYNFQFDKDYKSLKEFFEDTQSQGYKISFQDVSESYINEMTACGALYLFKIWNKDFSPYSKGTPNLHTMYWKALFDERNLNDIVFKLDGNAEIFFRKQSLKLKDTTIHKKNEAIQNKNKLNPKKSSTFAYDIIKNKRYTEDKFMFHVPISINYKANDKTNINEKVLQAIKNGEIKHIIGIDRGERNLLYLSLIDLQGNIVKQMNLNTIVSEYNNNKMETNYHQILADRETDRMTARRDWLAIENIKELKEGYLSQVVNIIAKMMVEYQAIVVIEDLNFGFMNSRQKIEKQVYQKFEAALTEKLQLLVDKKKDINEVGGLMKPLQLAGKGNGNEKQNGWIFRIPAWKTSKIDPVTGFTNMFHIRYENVQKSVEFFAKFDKISYNAEKDLFEFVFDYNKFGNNAKNTRTKWTLASYGPRIVTERTKEENNQWQTRTIESLTEAFKSAFADAGINISGDIKKSICSLTDKKHLEPLMKLMNLLVQLRNSKINSDVDYLISPAADENGNFFDSRQGIETLPLDADANGAYNIARKGLIYVRRIKESDKIEKLRTITNQEWLQFVQEKPYLND